MYENVFSVLQLDRPANISDMVEPAPLPEKNAPPVENFSQCTVSGWGVTGLYSQSLSSELMSVSVDYFSNCWSFYYYYSFMITSNMICAGSLDGGKDSCQVSFNICYALPGGCHLALTPADFTKSFTLTRIDLFIECITKINLRTSWTEKHFQEQKHRHWNKSGFCSLDKCTTQCDTHTFKYQNKCVYSYHTKK